MLAEALVAACVGSGETVLRVRGPQSDVEAVSAFVRRTPGAAVRDERREPNAWVVADYSFSRTTYRTFMSVIDESQKHRLRITLGKVGCPDDLFTLHYSNVTFRMNLSVEKNAVFRNSMLQRSNATPGLFVGIAGAELGAPDYSVQLPRKCPDAMAVMAALVGEFDDDAALGGVAKESYRSTARCAERDVKPQPPRLPPPDTAADGVPKLRLEPVPAR